MGVWRIDADVLASSRFVVSPMVETVGCLAAFTGQHRISATQREWLREYEPVFRARWGADPFALPFLRDAIRPGWLADFLVRPPRVEAPVFADDLARVAATTDEHARRDILETMDRPLTPVLHEDGLVARAVELLDWAWRHTVRPGWPRRRRVFEADIVARTGRLGTGGWAAVLDGMRPGMRWLGDGRLQINAYDYPPRDVTGSRLVFAPTTSARGWVSWEEPADVHAIIYPCTGWLAQDPDVVPPGALASLIGPARARILTLLAEPKSTTQLVALTGQTLGSAGGHLRVLRDAGLADRRRAGRSVLYYRTPLGDALCRGEPPVSSSGSARPPRRR
ncbi:ArsR/SmtB family transcription factor [Dactylosporangium darangshiense]|uniref:Winged helix-turn-helix domain-containing protein n=1 Tax=Dactylosporangium darangshiense TaxID=579108 RepID=A0ABP8D8A0_9ACTN